MTDPHEQSLSPLSFLLRSAAVWGDRDAVIDRGRGWTYAEHHARVCRMAGALRDELGVEEGDRIALLLPNVSAALELHYAVPGCGAVVVPLNIRLAAAEYRYILEHSGASVLFVYRGLEGPCVEALAGLSRPPRVVWVEEDFDAGSEYEKLAEGSAAVDLRRPEEERALLSINYTSGTTGRPKGVMVSHRGAYLHSLGQVVEAGLSTRSRYLWTLPMFHCNGWCYTWAVTAAGAAHLCVPAIDPEALWRTMLDQRVSHFCGAPAVINMLLEAEAARPCPAPVRAFVGGAPPTPALLERAEQLNFDVTHLYGLTETYGPLMICAWNPGWDQLPVPEKARLRARQGVPTIVSERARVVDAEMRDVPADGETAGEIVMRGNNVMIGYYRDPEATAAAFAGGWFHSGDAGVIHPDGYIELKDRLKDVIISGGENIATVEIEQVLVDHPTVADAAVVALADERWGEVPAAFVTARGGAVPDPAELRDFARARLAAFKVPKRIEVLDELPRTATGKVQKFVLRARLSSETARTQP
ncbi:MAG: long-chain-fatty-acid--CoA ligase [Solirubrobacterales bacterium]